MRCMVCIKQVPDTQNVEVDPVTGVLKRDGIDTKLNPYDLFAVEFALRLTEEYGGTVDVVTMGPNQAQEALIETLCMGANRGGLLSDRKFAGADVVATSYTISQGIRKMGTYDLIICGKQTTDGDTAQVGPEMAEFFEIPHSTNVNKVCKVTEDGITVQMNMGEYDQVQEMKYPCLLTIDKDVNTPRLPSYKKKKAVKDEQIVVMSFADFIDQNEKNYGLAGSATQVERIFPPEKRTDKELFQGTAEELASGMYQVLLQKKFV